MLLFTKL
jgi:hypothetical protein